MAQSENHQVSALPDAIGRGCRLYAYAHAEQNKPESPSNRVRPRWPASDLRAVCRLPGRVEPVEELDHRAPEPAPDPSVNRPLIMARSEVLLHFRTATAPTETTRYPHRVSLPHPHVRRCP